MWVNYNLVPRPPHVCSTYTRNIGEGLVYFGDVMDMVYDEAHWNEWLLSSHTLLWLGSCSIINGIITNHLHYVTKNQPGLPVFSFSCALKNMGRSGNEARLTTSVWCWAGVLNGFMHCWQTLLLCWAVCGLFCGCQVWPKLASFGDISDQLRQKGPLI